ncbi:hypothetical protein BC937DRAFT_93572 [Endogone sp. FLAS-F59071]|nr:hypothetical protein BC937DRAFT_93572 [Endogone sp. FLAS-F59071]|eukprot:RUS14602.1 hypothetical protein BC937DRAFT_93572 [Endogone sp. FLAS-F59071]
MDAKKLEADIEEMEGKMNMVEEKINTIENEIKGVKLAIETKELAINAAVDEINAAVNEIKEIKLAIKTKEELYNTTKDKNLREQLRAELPALRAELPALRAEKNILYERLGKFEQDLRAIKRRQSQSTTPENIIKDIWYHFEPSSASSRLDNFNGEYVDDLRKAIKAAKSDIPCTHDWLVLYIARPKEVDEVLDGALVRKHGDFRALIQHYQIGESNPIKVIVAAEWPGARENRTPSPMPEITTSPNGSPLKHFTQNTEVTGNALFHLSCEKIDSLRCSDPTTTLRTRILIQSVMRQCENMARMGKRKRDDCRYAVLESNKRRWQESSRAPSSAQFQTAMIDALSNALPIKFSNMNDHDDNQASMPLKERNFKDALATIVGNIEKAWKGRRDWLNSVATTEFEFLVCGGAPGIGKTRWGSELFKALNVWDLPAPWRYGSRPHFVYVHIDFLSIHHLNNYDQNVSTSKILGLRIAFELFVKNQYVIDFRTFQMNAAPHQKDETFAFDIVNVLQMLRERLNLPPTKCLFLLLHIDEFQKIFDFELTLPSASKGLFQDLICELGPFMKNANEAIYVQTFLSGTASQEVVRRKEASGYSFHFVNCPLLKSKALYEIVDHFAKKNGDDDRHWMRNRYFLRILADTGGLPRAVQFVLEACFSEYDKNTQELFTQLPFLDATFFNNIFNSVMHQLDSKYAITIFVQHHRHLSLELLRRCLGAIPVQLLDVLDSSEPGLTIEIMERNGRILVQKSPTFYDDNSYIINMPIFFICLYNSVLQLASGTLIRTIYPDATMEWAEWEQFVAYYEVFRTNLLFDLGMKEITLETLYRGAIGKPETLNIVVKLEKLEEVCAIREQFPVAKMRRLSDFSPVEFGSKIFLNGRSAPFGDYFGLREALNIEQKNVMIISQQKWDYDSAMITLNDIVTECNKNRKAIENAKDELRTTLKECRPITIIFTTQPSKCTAAELPDDCLVVAKEQFEAYFGPVFASRAVFGMVGDINLNFSSPARIIKVVEGIGKAIVELICQRRPYYDADEVIRKNPEHEMALKRYRKSLENCSYAPYSFIKKIEVDLDSDNEWIPSSPSPSPTKLRNETLSVD